MEKWNDRLKKAMAARGVNQADLVRATKKSSPSVSGWATGQTAMLDAESAAHICELLKINFKWLMFGKGPSGLEPPAREVLPDTIDVDIGGDYCPPENRRYEPRRDGDRRRDGEVEVPHMNIVGSMGSGISTPDHEYPVGVMKVELPWLRKNVHCTNPSNLVLIDARGNSMFPTFSDGDLLLVDRGIQEMKVDAIYALVKDGELFIKGIQRRRDGTYLMISHNHLENRDEDIGDASEFQIIGRVVWSWNGKKH